jgi:hypothetical protein
MKRISLLVFGAAIAVPVAAQEPIAIGISTPTASRIGRPGA